MRSIQDWLDEYGQSHRNPVNKALHWICVPVIVLAILGFLHEAPLPAPFASRAVAGWEAVVIALGLVYYAWLSPRLAIGMLPVLAALALAIARLEAAGPPLWKTCLALFVVAWIGQFIGHAVEGQRPSFFKDVQFLLIGPLWLLSAVYRRLGLRY